MKILISERQLGVISEQSWPSEYEKRELKKVDNQIASQDKLGKVVKKLGPNLDADDYTDIVSGLIDVIPGIGNLISGGIDITHGITYVARSVNAKSTEDKVEMSVMALITLGMAFVPVGGNAANMVARGEIKMLLRKTPYEIMKIAKDLGIIKKPLFNLSKVVWKYSLLIALVKIFRGRLDNAIGEVSRILTTIGNKSQDLKPIIDTYIKDMNELKTLNELA
jgi:hypothetical protein